MRSVLWVGCIGFVACTGPGNTKQVSSYPSAAAMLDSLVPVLENSRDTFYQNLHYHEEKPVTQPIKTPVNWKEVLEVFYTLDISKPALQGQYQQVKSTEGETLWNTFTTNKENLPVKVFAIQRDSLGYCQFTGQIRKDNLISGHEVSLRADLRNQDFSYEGRRWTLWSKDTVPFGVRVFK